MTGVRIPRVGFYARPEYYAVAYKTPPYREVGGTCFLGSGFIPDRVSLLRSFRECFKEDVTRQLDIILLIN